MILTLLALQAAAAPAGTAIDAERAFAARAARGEQWAAFRDSSTDTAMMFTPAPVVAHRYLAGRAEPKHPIQWWPAHSYVSCDGRIAVNTGPWTVPARGTSGYFTTIWVRQPDGAWKWIYDGGDQTGRIDPAGDRPRTRKAACRGRAGDVLGDPEPAAQQQAAGRSADGTLQWRWTWTDDGARALDVYLWNGREMERVIEDRVDPAQKGGGAG